MNKAVTDALEKVGNQGRYQTILGFLLFFAACEVNMLFFGPTFIYMNPSFDCSFVDEPVDESIACPRISECVISISYIKQKMTSPSQLPFNYTAINKSRVTSFNHPLH